jgi:hypothetical protein
MHRVHSWGVEMRGITAIDRGEAGKRNGRLRGDAEGPPLFRRAVDIEPAALPQPVHQGRAIVPIDQFHQQRRVEDLAAAVEIIIGVRKGFACLQKKGDGRGVRLREARFHGGGEQVPYAGRFPQPRGGRLGSGEALENFLPGKTAQGREIFSPLHGREGGWCGRAGETGIADKSEAVPVCAGFVRPEQFRRRRERRARDAMEAQLPEFLRLPRAVAMVGDLGITDQFQRRLRRQGKKRSAQKMGAKIVKPE